jgi:hypothetical protein
VRILIIVSLLLFTQASFSQLQFPKEFKLIKGENGSGEDDIYTDGRYSFDTHTIFRGYDFKKINDSVKQFVSDFFGYPFHISRDGLCWGTGRYSGFYSYVVVDWSGNLVELYSKYNDEKFSYYSNWLLSTIRQYKKEDKSSYFPIAGGN